MITRLGSRLALETPSVSGSPNTKGDRMAEKSVYPPCAEDPAQCGPAVHVAAGAAWLDAVAPGWERKVDLSTLDLEDPYQCICGQVAPIPPIDDIDYSPFGDVAVYFEWAGKLQHLGFGDLCDQDAWVDLIKERFETGQLSDGGS